MTVIHLHELDLWDGLCSRTEIVVPSIIAHGEALYYENPSTGWCVNIDLPGQIQAGEITEVAASLTDMQDFLAQLDSVTRASLHSGEIEALALLFKNQVEECRLCSADRAAVTALVLVGMKEKGISLEMALKLTGLSSSRLLHHYTEEVYRHWVREAEIQRIQGTGLAKDPLGCP